MQRSPFSRRDFLKASALLSVSTLLIYPTIAHFHTPEESKKNSVNHNSQIRADIRSVDFDSHDFRRNFRA